MLIFMFVMRGNKELREWPDCYAFTFCGNQFLNLLQLFLGNNKSCKRNEFVGLVCLSIYPAWLSCFVVYRDIHI